MRSSHHHHHCPHSAPAHALSTPLACWLACCWRCNSLTCAISDSLRPFQVSHSPLRLRRRLASKDDMLPSPTTAMPDSSRSGGVSWRGLATAAEAAAAVAARAVASSDSSCLMRWLFWDTSAASASSSLFWRLRGPLGVALATLAAAAAAVAALPGRARADSSCCCRLLIAASRCFSSTWVRVSWEVSSLAWLSRRREACRQVEGRLRVGASSTHCGQQQQRGDDTSLASASCGIFAREAAL